MRAAIAANLSAITGVQVSPYILGNPTLPTVEIVPGEVEYDKAMSRGHDDHVFTVRVIVAETTDIGSQVNLDEYMEGDGTRSIKETLESDKTLGGACQALRVVSCSGYRRAVMEGRGAVIAVDWRVEVMA